MPIFGDYETVGEPLAVLNLQGHSSAVWKARKTGASDGREFIVKCFTPRHKPGESGGSDALDRDHGLEFLEGIKQLKKAHSADPRYLVSVHDLGTSTEGVWYASDYYPRGSLMALIGRRAKVDSAGLRQIVRCIIAGCLTLRNSRGVSHGNLKVSNVFLAGKPRPLPSTPLLLADPVPAAPLQLARLETEDRKTIDDLLHQTAEVQDLRALGEIILQLVERRLIRSGYCDPPQRSEMWDNLGKDGERWRQLCVQLLDPQLSLAETSLDSLSKKFPAHAASGKVLTVAAAVAAIALIAGSAYGFARWNTHRHVRNCRNSTSAARQAFQRGDLVEASHKIQDALNWEPKDGDALGLSASIESQIGSQYNSSVALATKDFNAGRFSEALKELSPAFNLRPGGPEAMTLKKRIEDAQSTASNKEALRQQYLTEMTAATNFWDQARSDFDNGNFDVALVQLQSALDHCSAARKYNQGTEPGQLEGALTALQDRVRQRQQAEAQNIKAAAERSKSYAAAIQEATNAWNRAEAQFKSDHFSEALTEMQSALALCTTAGKYNKTEELDQLEKALKNRQTEIKTAQDKKIEQWQKYFTAMNAATNAWKLATNAVGKQDYPAALVQLQYAMDDCSTAEKSGQGAEPGRFEGVLKSLKEEIQQYQAAATERLKNYTAALQSATNALNGAESQFTANNYDEALKQLKSALDQCATAGQYGQGAELSQFQSYLQKRQLAMATARDRKLEQHRNYVAALTAATNSWVRADAQYKGGHFDEALTELKSALDQCAAAGNYEQGADLGQLTRVLTAYQSKVVSDKDQRNAQAFFDQGQYDQAAALCDKHAGEVFFKSLAATNRFEADQLAQDTNSYNKGDYSFVDGLASAGYAKKTQFANLLTMARPEADVFNQLKSLVANANNWTKVNDILKAQSNGKFINKAGFDQFRTWVARNDPLTTLDSQLVLFEVWFSKRPTDPKIIDPRTSKPAAKMGGGIDLQPYYDLLDKLKAGYTTLEGPQSSRLPRIAAVRKAMDNWY